MDYLEFTFEVTPVDPGAEIIMAALGELPFDSFVETESGLQAYIPAEEFNQEDFDELYIWQLPNLEITHSQKRIEQQNWNAVWESNFEPIIVDDQCVVRAPFHEKADVPYEIIIEPKMSFGTGHHETTHLMMKHLLGMDLEGKSVCDMGSGTGVLAILAEMRGAKEVLAVDIDEWAYENALDNCKRNNCHHITVEQGDVNNSIGKTFDVYIANINRNILVRDLEHYSASTVKGGTLLLSGFYDVDADIIRDAAQAVGFEQVGALEKNSWNALRFIKL